MRIEVSGPKTIAPGSVGQFTVAVVYGNGTTEDVTGEASWCCHSDALQVQGQGRVFGRNRGDATITVHYKNMFTSREVIVLPDGTYRVTGRVYEPGTTSPIAQARISVNDGAGSSLSTDADFSGFFRLYGVPPSAEFVVSHTGYETQSRRMQFSDHAAITLELPLTGPRLQFSGTYTATFDWRACSSAVQFERRRIYTAVVTQAGPVLDVRFTDQFFAINSAKRGNMMQGQIDAAGVTLYADRGFSLTYYYGPTYYPFIVERLPDGNRLVASGTAKLVQSGVSFSGDLKGAVEIYTQGFPYSLLVGTCSDASLSFTDRR